MCIASVSVTAILVTLIGTMGVDALAAIGLAGNIVQFVDFSIKLFSQSREIYVSGAETTAANNDLEKITQSLKEFSDRFSNSSEPGNLSTAGISWEEQELYSVSQECRSTADFLLSTLQKLKRRGGNVKWSSFRQALGVMWKKSKIDQTVSRLNAFRDQLSLCLLQILRYISEFPLSSNTWATGFYSAASYKISRAFEYSIPENLGF